MSTVTVGKSAGPNLKTGAAILAAARTADTKLVKDRLAAFERAQKGYADAQAKLQQIETDLEKAQAQLRTDQAGLMDSLARALVADGQPLRSPFGAFGGTSATAVLRAAPAAGVKAIADLAAAIGRSKAAGKATQQAVAAAEKSVRALEQMLARINGLRNAAADARATRDAVGRIWQSALSALKRGARAAADDGAPTLYPTLFERATRSNGKNHKSAAPESPPAPAPAVTPAANPQPEPQASAS